MCTYKPLLYLSTIHINSPGTLHLMQSEEQWNGHWLGMDSVVDDL